MYSIKHLQYIVAVGRAGSFSKAAHTCHVTQSTLSLGVKELERQMGVTLFERSRKNIIPTPAGARAINHAKDIVERNEMLKQDMESLVNPNAGPLRLGAIPTIAPYFLPQFLPTVEREFTKSSVQVAEDPTEMILDKVQSGKMDLGVLAFPIDTRDLEYCILFEEDFLLVHPHQVKFKNAVDIESLSHDDLLLLRDGHCLKDHVLSACNVPEVRKNQFFEADSLHTLLAMVNQGYGMTLLPKMAVDAGITKPYPHVEIKDFSGDVPKRQIGLVWRRADVRRASYLNLDF